MASRALPVVLAVTAALIAGCGGGGPARSTSPATSSGTGLPLASGETVFTEHCSVCHTLSGHDDPRHQGGDLLHFHATRAQVVQFVREMPVVHRPLTVTELQAVVDYVMAAERAAATH